MKRFVDFIFKYRIFIITITAILTVFFGYQLKNLKINSDVISYLPKDDLAVTLFHEIGKKFKGNSLAIIAIEDSCLFTKNSLLTLDSLTEKLKLLNGISSVTSLTNIIDIKKTSDGMEISRLIDPSTLPDSLEFYKNLKEYILSKDMYKERLVSVDGKTTVIICQLADESDKMKTVEILKKAVNSAKLSGHVYFGGMPEMVYQINTLIFSDLFRLIPTVSILIIITLLIGFGTIRGVIIPLLSVLIAVVWTLGTMSLFNIPLTIISDIIPVILIAVGTAPCIHILAKYDENPIARYGNTNLEAKRAFREVCIRIILASITIIFGFTSFIFGSYLTMIKEFGIFTSLGVFFSLLISTMFVPSLLSFIKIKEAKNKMKNSLRKNTLSDTIMINVGKFVLSNAIFLMLVGILILIFGIIGFPRIQRKVDIVDYFKENTQIKITEDILEQRFGGSRPVYLYVKGDMKNPFVLKEMQRTKKFLKSLNCIKNSQSIADLIAKMNDVMVGEEIIPPSKAKVNNLYFLLEGNDIVNQMLNSDKTEGIILAMVGKLDVKKMNTIVNGINNYISKQDTQLLIFNLGQLPDTVKTILYKKRINKISEQILWALKEKSPQTQISLKKLEEQIFLAGYLPSFATATDSLRNSVASLLLENICKSNNIEKDSSVYYSLKQELFETFDDTVSFFANEVQNEKRYATEQISFFMGHTGMPLIYSHLDYSLIKSQIESFIIALIFIYILIAFQLRSFVGGFFGLIPILLTVVLMFGIMGFAKIPIDVATVLAASVALGIGIDYSIHFSVRFKTFFKGIDKVKDALDNTLKTTGRAIIINALAVTMGFITLIFANLVPLSHFGVLVAITMIGSAIGALTLLPSIILLSKAKFMKKWEQRSHLIEDLN
jgi:predicted RND superfamily exporter protein